MLYKFMHCDEVQVNVGNIMEKGSNFCKKYLSNLKTMLYSQLY